MAMKDEGELLYTTLVGMIMAAIFATRLHDDVERTLTNLAPEGSCSDLLLEYTRVFYYSRMNFADLSFRVVREMLRESWFLVVFIEYLARKASNLFIPHHW